MSWNLSLAKDQNTCMLLLHIVCLYELVGASSQNGGGYVPRANIPKEQTSGSWHFYDVASKSQCHFLHTLLLDTVQRHTNTGRERMDFSTQWEEYSGFEGS